MRQPRILPHEKCAFPGTSTGKRARRTPVASGSLSSISSFNSGSLSICDSESGTTFLVDSGADVSVLPATAQDRRCLPSGRSLVAANGTSICTYGSRTLPLTFPGLKTSHSFLLADVPRPILGSDFFAQPLPRCDLRCPSTTRNPRRPLLRHPCLHLFMASLTFFVRIDAVKPPLTRPYAGPFLVLSPGPKTFVLSKNGSPWTVSADRLKPAFGFPSPDSTSPPPSSVPPPVASEPAAKTPIPTAQSPTPAASYSAVCSRGVSRFGRVLRSPVRYS